MRTRTTAAAIALIAASALALTGCGRSDSGDSAEPDAATTIGSGDASGEITLWAMGAEGEALPKFLEGFTKEHPDITVNVTAIPWDAAHNKIQTAIAGGGTPDIAMMGTTWMPDFADSFAAVPTDLDTSGFFAGALATNKTGDRLVGVPWYVDTRVMYYRTDLAEKAGWSKPPTTWDDLTHFATDLKEKAGTKWGIRLQASGDGTFQSNLWMPWSAGGELSDGKKWTVDTDAFATGLQYYQDFFAKDLADANMDPNASTTATDFVSGDAPIVIEGPFLMGQIEAAGGAGFTEKYATAPVPADTASVSFSGGSNLVVFKESKNQAAAFTLMQWLSDPAQQAAFFTLTGDLPSVEKTWSDPLLTDNPKFAAFGTQLKTASAPPAVSTWSQVAAAGDTLWEKVAKSTMTPAEALAELQKQADAIGFGG